MTIYTCENLECDGYYSTERLLKKHKSTFHQQEDGTYKCRMKDCMKELKTGEGMERHISKYHPQGADWDDAQRLDRLWNEERLTLEEIAEKLGCSSGSKIKQKMDDYGIEKKKKYERIAYLYTRNGGRMWNDYGSGKSLSVHKLLACVNNDPHEVFDSSTRIHHGNDNHPHLPKAEHPLANWEGNLVLMNVRHHKKYISSKEGKISEGRFHQSALDW